MFMPYIMQDNLIIWIMGATTVFILFGGIYVIRFKIALKCIFVVRADLRKSLYILDGIVEEWRANFPVMTSNSLLSKSLTISLKSNLKCKLTRDKWREIVSPLHKWLPLLYMLLTKNADCNLPLYTVLIWIQKSSIVGPQNLTRNDLLDTELAQNHKLFFL